MSARSAPISATTVGRSPNATTATLAESGRLSTKPDAARLAWVIASPAMLPEVSMTTTTSIGSRTRA